MRQEIIRVKNASKSFRGHEVLKKVSLTCESGHIYGIIGYNGSGKTVLFKSICGLYRLDEGEIWIGNKKMKRDIDMLTEAGIIIEEPSFLRNYSGFKNLDFLYRIRNRKDKEHLYEVMRKVGLDPLSKKRVCNYSLGMRQRLAIAQAIMEDQNIILLDEGFNALDSESIKKMKEVLLSLKNENRIILLSSHVMDDFKNLVDEIYLLKDGKLEKS